MIMWLKTSECDLPAKSARSCFQRLLSLGFGFGGVVQRRVRWSDSRRQRENETAETETETIAVESLSVQS